MYMYKHTQNEHDYAIIVNPLVSLRMSPASMAPACSFHREKHIDALLSATRHFRTTLPSLVWLVVPAKKDSMHAYHVTLPASLWLGSRSSVSEL